MDSNPWELYSTEKGWHHAHEALERAWRVASRMETEELAREYMGKVMARYSEYGALDSEPLAELESRIRLRKSTW